jgi:hypothetical protein
MREWRSDGRRRDGAPEIAVDKIERQREVALP